MITWPRFGGLRGHFVRTSAGLVVSRRGKLGLASAATSSGPYDNTANSLGGRNAGNYGGSWHLSQGLHRGRVTPAFLLLPGQRDARQKGGAGVAADRPDAGAAVSQFLRVRSVRRCGLVPTPRRPAYAIPDEIAATSTFALRYDGTKRLHQADDAIARITAERLVRQLERSGYVLMGRPPAVVPAARGCHKDPSAKCNHRPIDLLCPYSTPSIASGLNYTPQKLTAGRGEVEITLRRLAGMTVPALVSVVTAGPCGAPANAVSDVVKRDWMRRGAEQRGSSIGQRSDTGRSNARGHREGNERTKDHALYRNTLFCGRARCPASTGGVWTYA